MTIKHLWIFFTVAAAVSLPVRVYQLFFLLDGETDFLVGGTPTTILIALFLIAVTVVAVLSARQDKTLSTPYVPPHNGLAAFVGALTGLFMIFESVNLIMQSQTEIETAQMQEAVSRQPYVQMITAWFGIFAALSILVTAVGFMRGTNPLRKHPLVGLLPTLWGCMCMVLLFVTYTAKANATQNIYDMLTVAFLLMFFFVQAKLCAGFQEERSLRFAYMAGIPAILFALVGSLPCVLLTIAGRRVPGEFPAGMHSVILMLAIYMFVWLILLYSLPKQEKIAPNAVDLSEKLSAKE